MVAGVVHQDLVGQHRVHKAMNTKFREIYNLQGCKNALEYRVVNLHSLYTHQKSTEGCISPPIHDNLATTARGADSTRKRVNGLKTRSHLTS